MPDYRLEYLLQNTPWGIDELGLAPPGEEGTFYTLGTGHAPDDIDFFRDAILVRATINHDDPRSVKEYLAAMFLNDIDPDAGTVRNRRRVIDGNMAAMIDHPTIWTESAGDPATKTYNQDEFVVPERIYIYERVPFNDRVNSVDELETELMQITNQSLSITLPEERDE